MRILSSRGFARQNIYVTISWQFISMQLLPPYFKYQTLSAEHASIVKGTYVCTFGLYPTDTKFCKINNAFQLWKAIWLCMYRYYGVMLAEFWQLAGIWHMRFFLNSILDITQSTIKSSVSIAWVTAQKTPHSFHWPISWLKNMMRNVCTARNSY